MVKHKEGALDAIEEDEESEKNGQNAIKEINEE